MVPRKSQRLALTQKITSSQSNYKWLIESRLEIKLEGRRSVHYRLEAWQLSGLLDK